MSVRYWEDTQPLVVDTKRNILRYYEGACKLQVSMPNWTDDKEQERQGKTVTLDVTALRECPEAMEIIKQIAKYTGYDKLP